MLIFVQTLLIGVIYGTGASASDDDYDGKSFDYIIIGAGTAGSVVAAELSKSMPEKEILLIEEGYYSNVNPNIDDALAWYSLLTDVTMERFYYSTPQAELDDKEVHLSRARVTGGCNSHNGQFWILGNENDFSERWGNIDGWTLDDILPIWDEVESVAYHGMSFWTQEDAANNPDKDPMMARFIEAGINIGYNENFNYNAIDVSKGERQGGVGGSIHESEMIENDDGSYYYKRRSSWTDYVEPIIATQSNLHVLTMTRVDKLVVGGTSNNRIEGVVAYHRGKLKKLTFYANEEVILSAGAIDTPKLLMLSGIGDCILLENEYDIECVSHLPGIGQNLMDHFVFYPTMAYFTDTSDLVYRKKIGFPGWSVMLIPDKGEMFTTFNVGNIDSDTDTWVLNAFGIAYHTYSIGNVKLQDSDVLSKPVINPNYLSDDRDKELAIKLLKEMRKYVFDSGDAFDGILLNDDLSYEIAPGSEVETDDDILKWVKQNMDVGGHFIGTCKMGYDDDNTDDMIVVNQRLKVRNFENLRVIDASIMPNTISANTNAMTMVIGMKGAKMIIEDYNNNNNNNNNNDQDSDSSDNR